MRSADLRYMRMALDACRQGIESGQTPFGACIVRADAVLACKHNRVWSRTDITAHAEIEAIRAACRHVGRIHLVEATIYSTTEPCPMCFSAIHWSQIRRIVYGATVIDARSFGFNELQISNEVMIQTSCSDIELKKEVLREEALELYRIWQERGKAY